MIQYLVDSRNLAKNFTFWKAHGVRSLALWFNPPSTPRPRHFWKARSRRIPSPWAALLDLCATLATLLRR